MATNAVGEPDRNDAPSHVVSVPSRPLFSLDGDLSRTALIVVDMQNMFVAPGEPAAAAYARGNVPRINALASFVRERGGAVVWIRHTVEPDGEKAPSAWMEQVLGPDTAGRLRKLVPGAWEWEVYSALDVQKEDLFFQKYRASAFLPDWSGLHDGLQARGIDSVIITGCITNFCSQSTARDAMMRDYRTFFVSDGNGAYDDETHNRTVADLAGMGLFDVRTAQELMDAAG